MSTALSPVPPLTVAQFRNDFPEFGDVDAYPDAIIQSWITVALTVVNNGARWGALLNTGQELAAAHFLVLQKRDLAAAATGAIPGTVEGLTTAGSVDNVSVSYDVSSISFEGAGFWNSTSYGLKFISLRRMIGAGGIQLGGCAF